MTAVAALASLGRERELAQVGAAAGPETSAGRAARAAARTRKRWAASRVTRPKPGRGCSLSSDRATPPRSKAWRARRARRCRRRGDRSPRVPSDDTLTGDRRRRAPRRRRSAPGHLSKAANSPAAPVAASDGVGLQEADQQKARDMVAAMQPLVDAARYSRSCARAYAAPRVAWVELLADADIHPTRRGRFEDCVRPCSRAPRRGRSRARRCRTPRRRARTGAGRSRVPCARASRRSAATTICRTASRSHGRRGKACRRCPRRGRRSSISRFAEACRAAEKRFERRSLAKQLPPNGCRRSCPRSRRSRRSLRLFGHPRPVVRARKQWQAIARESRSIPS